MFKKLCRVVKALPLIKLFSFNRMIFTKPKNQKTKTFQRMFGLRFMFGFFLVFLEFFCFFWVMTLKKLKKTQGFFGFLDKLMVKDL